MTTGIIVIGGGIAGLSAAAALAGHAEVTVLEAEAALGYHSSGRSAALIEKNYGAPSVQALNHATFDPLEAGGYLSPRGLMILGKPGEDQAFAQDCATLGTKEVAVGEACAMVPILDPGKIIRAAYHAEAFDIDTDRLLQDFARQVRGAGGRIHFNARVTEIVRTTQGWQVHAGDRTWHGARIVNAAGAWADQVAALAGIAPIGLTPYRRSMARLPAPGGHDVSGWPMFFGVGETWYAKPDAGHLLVSPADEDPVEPHDAWPEDLTLAEGLARYEAVVTEPVTRLQSSWAGLRSFAPDRTLVLGPEPDEPSFVWCAAQGGYGFQTSFGAARLLADLVLGRAPDLPQEVVAQLTPGRLW